MNHVQFSILVVSLNPGQKLIKTVDSILEQDFEDYEILIKDGGSRDGSLDALPEKEKIRKIVRKDTGIYDAMNQAVTEAAGEFVLFLNCGDSFHDAEVLKRTAKMIKDSPEADIYYGDTYCEKTDSLQVAPGSITPFVCFRNIPCHQACFYRRKLFKERQYLPEYRIRADYEHFLWCVLERKAKTLALHFTVADYEGGGYSESKENKRRDREEHKEITRKYLSGPQLLICRLYLFVTLAPLRRKLADSKRFAAWYEKIKAGLRK